MVTVPNGPHRELLNKRARDAVRDEMSGTVLREIDEMWQDEGFPPPEDEHYESVGGERVTLFQGYLNRVDWTHPSHVTRALKVFEVAVRHLFQPPHGWAPPLERIARLRRLFGRDGYSIDDQGRITGGVPTVLEPEHLSDLRDADVVLEHLARIEGALVRDDPALAIGSAKELVESAARIVLAERGRPVAAGNEDLPKLVARAEEALGVDPAGASAGPDGSNTVRKILGAVHTVTIGIAELRNTYGTGHGRTASSSGLGPRHARLAVNGARLWCQFMLDTISDPRAPWQVQQDASAELTVATGAAGVGQQDRP